MTSEVVKSGQAKKNTSAGGKFTLAKLQRQYAKKQPLTMVTAYDSTMGHLAEEGGIDIILVGDSVGNVMLGYDSTVPVTMEEMVHHTRAVTRSAKRALVIGDMPFGSYLEPGPALMNAARLLKEGGCDAVKLEGGCRVAHIVQALTDAGVAVMGHIGLTPQTHAQLGGYRVQGKSTREALLLLEDAAALQRAGAFAIVLECVPSQLAEELTQRLAVPTIGIGAGPKCSGQVLVCADMLGTQSSPPRFVKQYASLGSQIVVAFAEFRHEVEQGIFPEMRHSTEMSAATLAELRSVLPASVGLTTSDSRADAALVAELRQELDVLRQELHAKAPLTSTTTLAANNSIGFFCSSAILALAMVSLGSMLGARRSINLESERFGLEA